MELITNCFTPAPEVVVVDAVMDTKSLFNPTHDTAFHESTAICHRTRGCCTGTIQPGRDWFMGPTTALHWRMRRECNNSVIMQVKHTCDDEAWSQSFYPWTTEAPRPNNREFIPGSSGLLPSDLTLTARAKVMTATRTAELQLALEHVRLRLSADQWAEAQAMFTRVSTPTDPQPLPPGFGKFKKDDFEETGVNLPPARVMMARQHTVFESQQSQNAGRAQRKVQGHASETLMVNNFIAYPCNYPPETNDDDKQDFWVGQIVVIDPENLSVTVNKWYTSRLRNATDLDTAYKRWSRKSDGTTTVLIEDILETFKLTPKNRIAAPRRRHIKQSIILHNTNTNPTRPVDLAVGYDIAENNPIRSVAVLPVGEEEEKQPKKSKRNRRRRSSSGTTEEKQSKKNKGKR